MSGKGRPRRSKPRVVVDHTARPEKECPMCLFTNRVYSAALELPVVAFGNGAFESVMFALKSAAKEKGVLSEHCEDVISWMEDFDRKIEEMDGEQA